MSSISVSDLNRADARTWETILKGPPETAVRWLRAAAEQGVIEAQVRLGQHCLEGNGLAEDRLEAVRWFRLAAREGHPMGMNMLGRCYENAWGLEHDAVMAAYWFRHAALAGLDWGQYNYATSLALGRGVPVDKVQALDFFRRAAAQGHAKSWNLLGGFHEDGWVVEADAEQALACYLEAAAGGDFRGQFNAARLLAARGRSQAAGEWLRQAWNGAHDAFRIQMRAFLAQSGHPILRAALDELRS